MQGILGYTDEDVVSNDFVGDSRSLLLLFLNIDFSYLKLLAIFLIFTLKKIYFVGQVFLMRKRG